MAESMAVCHGKVNGLYLGGELACTRPGQEAG